MPNIQLLVKKETTPVFQELMQTVIEELRLLRSEVALLLPQEDLKDYAHPQRIRRSYEKALKKYPPAASVWK